MTDRHKTHFSLIYLPLLIQLKCHETASLPDYMGSTLHGIMGWALLPHKDVYQYLFENRSFGGAKQDIINPYIIEPPGFHGVYKAGEELRFQFILLGDAVQYCEPVIKILAETRWFKMGAERKLFELTEIRQGQTLQLIWKNGGVEWKNAVSQLVPDTAQKNSTYGSIYFLTPLRIRRKGSLLLTVDFPTIIRNITRRMSDLTERYGGYVDFAEIETLQYLSEMVQEVSSGVYLNNIDRYSTRRNMKMDLSGLMGAMTFQGELSVFTPWLNAASVLHIGRNVTFGCGKIDVVFGNIE